MIGLSCNKRLSVRAEVTEIKLKMQGYVTTAKGDTYVFRDDHGHDPCVWAWNIHDTDDGDRAMTHKWANLPRRSAVVLFEVDNPPCTVPYVPILR